jgi:hypothetical protein
LYHQDQIPSRTRDFFKVVAPDVPARPNNPQLVPPSKMPNHKVDYEFMKIFLFEIIIIILSFQSHVL